MFKLVKIQKLYMLTFFSRQNFSILWVLIIFRVATQNLGSICSVFFVVIFGFKWKDRRTSHIKKQLLKTNLKPKKILISMFFIYNWKALNCKVLYCIVLYCIVLYCTVLYCIVLYCIVLYCIVLYCIVLYLFQRRRGLNCCSRCPKTPWKP